MVMPKINRTSVVWLIVAMVLVVFVTIISLPVYWVVNWFTANRVTGPVYLNEINTLIYPGSAVLTRSSSVTYDPRDTRIFFTFKLPSNVSFDQFYVWQKRRFEAKGWQIENLSKDTATVDGKYVPYMGMVYELTPSMPVTKGPLNVQYTLVDGAVEASSECIWDPSINPHINRAHFHDLFP